jgi:hypothetical protein
MWVSTYERIFLQAYSSNTGGILLQRLVIHFVIGLVTFFIGVAVSNLTANPYVTFTPKVREVEPVTHIVSEPPEQFGITRPAPNLIFDYNPEEFNPRGDYFIVGPRPKGFREFDCLELAVDHERASGVIMIQSYENQTYDAHYAVSGLVTNKRLTFVVAPVSEDGLEYSFDGYFLRGAVLSDAGKNSAVLKGRLSKSKGGVRVAEDEVQFRIEYLGC